MGIELHFALLILVSSVFAGRIIVVPSNGFSHCTDMAIVSEVLVSHGHAVTMLISSAHPCDFRADRKFDVATISVNIGRQEFADNQLDVIVEGMVNPWNMSAFATGMKMLADLCEEMLKNGNEVIGQLRRQKFDIAILDDASFCGIFPVNQLDLPFIGISTMSAMVEFFSNSPKPISYVPCGMLSQHTDKMTFFDRLTNGVQCALSPLAKKLMYWHFDSLNIKYSVRPESSVAEMFAEMELILWNRDFTFEFPQPIMPHVIPYGSITTKPASPLERDLESFMQSAENGVAIVSFGTFIVQLKGETLGRLPDVIAKALSRLPLNVIWKFKGAKTPSLGNNTKIMEWLPLNDLLGHPKTRVFINQAGIMGIYEAIYHGVPMVAVPFFGDQLSNAARVKAKGMGPVLHASDVTEDKLYQSVMDVLTNDRYKLNMERYSKIYKDKPMNNTETIAFWVDYVIKHGAKHLHSEARNLSFMAYYLIDVISVVLVVTIIIMSIIVWACRILCSCCKKTKQQKYKVS